MGYKDRRLKAPAGEYESVIGEVFETKDGETLVVKFDCGDEVGEAVKFYKDGEAFERDMKVIAPGVDPKTLTQRGPQKDLEGTCVKIKVGYQESKDPEKESFQTVRVLEFIKREEIDIDDDANINNDPLDDLPDHPAVDTADGEEPLG